MTTPERYTNTCGSGLCMDRAPDGEWVSYDDYLALRAEVAHAVAGMNAALDKVIEHRNARHDAESRAERLADALMEYGLPLTGDDIQDAWEFGDEAVAREKRRRAALAQEDRA